MLISTINHRCQECGILLTRHLRCNSKRVAVCPECCNKRGLNDLNNKFYKTVIM